MALQAPKQLFRSFLSGGFEGACHINRAGERLDLIHATQHDLQACSDYARLNEMGIRTARDGVRWHLIDRNSRFDFSSFLPMLSASLEAEVQIIWTLCHYGWPDDIDPLTPAFIKRFASYCRATARVVADSSDEVPFFCPMNEISFLAWAAGEQALMSPYLTDQGSNLKCQLVRAVIEGSEAIWEVSPRARIVHVDPAIHVVAPRGRPDLADATAAQRSSQFEAWDMLCGRARAELGGHPKYLDVMGINFYHANQWEHPDIRLRWEDLPRDNRWLPFSSLLKELYERYGADIFVGETSHFGKGRGPWLMDVAREVKKATEAGVPVQGICLYPIIDRPDWEDPEHWHNSGLWDLRLNRDGILERQLDDEYARAVTVVQHLFDEPLYI
jgi:hypothetical protein